MKETRTKRRKKIPAVVLDIDDTIVDFIGFLCYLYNHKYGTTITEADLISWGFEEAKVTDVRGNVVNGSELRQFFIEYENHGLYSALPPIKESVLAMSLMKTLGYKIILLTARKKDFEKDTEINFIVNNIPYDEIIFGGNKVDHIVELAKTHQIAIFADDKFDYIKSIWDTDHVGTCYLINRSHNRNAEELEGVFRVNDLLEVVRHLPDVTKY